MLIGPGKFWSRTDQRVKKGLELSSLAIIDVEDGTAYSMEAEQTPVLAQWPLKNYRTIDL